MNVENLAVELVRHLGDAGVRAVAIALPMALVAFLLRRRASLESAVWTVVLAAMLALPLLRPLTPPTRLPVRATPFLAMLAGAASPARPLPAPRRAMSFTPPTTAPTAHSHTWQFYAAIVYLLGFSLLTARLLAGLLITRRIVRRATPLPLDCGAHAFESTQVRVPVTAGYLFPRILLPPEWRTWEDSTRTAVLAHEAAHVRRRDGLVNLIAAINTCAFWFHPLAWWLERRLAVLAEYAADDIAMESCPDPKQYASILLSIAAACNGRKHRLLWGSVSMEGGRIAGRIHRALDSQPRAARLNRFAAVLLWPSAALLVWFAGAVQFQSVARAQQYPPHLPESLRLTPAQVAQLEQQHAANPDDEAVTQKLLTNYWFTGRQQDRAAMVFWMIDHHPEWQLNATGNGSFFRKGPQEDPAWRANYEEARKKWAVQVAQHPQDPRILGNAAAALDGDDEVTIIEYLQRAQKIDPVSPIDQNYCRWSGSKCDWTAALARQYARFVVGHGPATPQLDAQVQETLRTTTDAGLILATVQWMLMSAGQSALGGQGQQADLAQVRSTATALLDRAQQLQPGSQQLVELREGVRQLGVTLVVPESAATAPAYIRVGGGVQSANLMDAPAPVYPPNAKANGIQGTVRLQVRINAAGRMDTVSVISGDPVLIDAAIAAVQQYVYKPTLLNGKPTAVVTTVDVPFR